MTVALRLAIGLRLRLQMLSFNMSPEIWSKQENCLGVTHDFFCRKLPNLDSSYRPIGRRAAIVTSSNNPAAI